jgi:hypothetical protein
LSLCGLLITNILLCEIVYVKINRVYNAHVQFNESVKMVIYY